MLSYHYLFGSLSNVLWDIGRNLIKQSHMIAMIVRIEYTIGIMRDMRYSLIGSHIIYTNAWKITTQINNNLRSVSGYFCDATSYLMGASVDGDVHINL
jgi:hypothetical protein